MLHKNLFEVMKQSSTIERHLDFFLWLNGNLQSYVPNEIVLATWGNYTEQEIHFDVISAEPGVRTQGLSAALVAALAKNFFARWTENQCRPFAMIATEGIHLEHALCSEADFVFDATLQRMGSALIHGIKNQRGADDCLYLFFNSSATVEGNACAVLEILLPYIDAAHRRVPALCDATVITQKIDVLSSQITLSSREKQIMEWVRKGKTNHEIGLILDISIFTVKNHLQRIFKKLDVMNRAQAVATVGDGSAMDAITSIYG